MAINPYQRKQGNVGELLAIVNTLSGLGALPGATKDAAPVREQQAKSLQLENTKNEASMNAANNAAKANAVGLMSIVNQKVKAGAMSKEDGRLFISSIMDEAGNPKLNAAEIEALQKNMAHGDPTNTIIGSVGRAEAAATAKRLPADKVLSVNDGGTAISMLGDLSKTIDDNANSFGPVLGRLSSFNPYDETAKTIDAQARTAAQTVGKFMEGGVLRKEDEDKYRKMLPQLSDAPDVARNKLQLVDRMLKTKMASDVDALKKSGYDTSGFNGKTQQSPQVPQAIRGGKKPAALQIDHAALDAELQRRGIK